MDDKQIFILRIYPALLCTTVFLGITFFLWFLSFFYSPTSLFNNILPFLIGATAFILILLPVIYTDKWKKYFPAILGKRAGRKFIKIISTVLLIGFFLGLGGDLVISVATTILAFGNIIVYRYRLSHFVIEKDRIEKSYLYRFTTHLTSSRKVKMFILLIFVALMIFSLNLRFIGYFINQILFNTVDINLVILTFFTIILAILTLLISLRAILSPAKTNLRFIIAFSSIIIFLILAFIQPLSQPLFYYLHKEQVFRYLVENGLIRDTASYTIMFSRVILSVIILMILIFSTIRKNFDFSIVKYYKTLRKIELTMTARFMIFFNSLFIIVGVATASQISLEELSYDSFFGTYVVFLETNLLQRFFFIGVIFMIFYFFLYYSYYQITRDQALSWIQYKNDNMSEKNAIQLLPSKLKQFGQYKNGREYNKKYYSTMGIIYISTFVVYLSMLQSIHPHTDLIVILFFHPEFIALLSSAIFLIPPTRYLIEEAKIRIKPIWKDENLFLF